MREQPATLPVEQFYSLQPRRKSVHPPKPTLSLELLGTKEVLISWRLPTFNKKLHSRIMSFKIYSSSTTESPDRQVWQMVGVVAATALPMARSLQLATDADSAIKHFIAICAVDVHGRIGPMSEPLLVDFSQS